MQSHLILAGLPAPIEEQLKCYLMYVWNHLIGAPTIKISNRAFSQPPNKYIPWNPRSEQRKPQFFLWLLALIFKCKRWDKPACFPWFCSPQLCLFCSPAASFQFTTNKFKYIHGIMSMFVMCKEIALDNLQTAMWLLCAWHVILNNGCNMTVRKTFWYKVLTKDDPVYLLYNKDSPGA